MEQNIKKTILLTNHYSANPYAIVNEELPEGFQLKMLESNTQECIESAVVEADYILASGRVKITKSVLDNAKKLKMIQRTGVGLDSLDLTEIKKRSIPLYVNQGINAESVAEHTLLLMLACLRRLTQIHKNTIGGTWKKQEQGIQTYELSGKKIGLVGMGNIAQKVVKLLSGFDVTIYYYDVCRLPIEQEHQLGVIYCSFENILSRVDVLSLHCPLNETTKKLINQNTLASMKRGSILINTARGGLVDTDALVDALRVGKIAFAGLDVFEEEPLKEDNVILEVDNVILTPHISGITNDSFRQMMHDAMRNIEKFEHGQLEEIQQYLH